MTNEEYGKIVSKNLKRLLFESGKMQVEVADDLGIAKTTLNTWLNGSRVPKIESIDKLAHYFGVTRDEIMMPYGMVPIETMSAFERNIILAYRNASTDRKEAVLLLLGMKE